MIHKQKEPLQDQLTFSQEDITLPRHQYCIQNLAGLTTQLARNELMSIIHPRVAGGKKQHDE
jgi:hypothetical protein